MAGLTLTQARARVREHVDDPNSRRWTDGQLDGALASASSRCLEDYAGSGGERFDDEATGTSSATDGTLSLSSTPPLLIRSVQVLVGSGFERVRPIYRVDREYLDNVARSLRVTYVREFALPGDGGHPLIGVGATGANTWIAFDEWVCARAAQQMHVKDRELSRSLASLEQDLRASVLLRGRNPQAREWPTTGASVLGLRYAWLPTTQTLQLCTSWGRW